MQTKYDERRITENHSNRRGLPDRAEFNLNLVTAFSVIVREPNDDDTANVGKDGNVVKDVVKDVIKELSERQILILEIIEKDPSLSAKAMSEKMTQKTTQKNYLNIRRL